MNKPLSTAVKNFHHHLDKTLRAGDLVSLSLGDYDGDETELKKILARQIMIKRQTMLSLTYRYKSRDIVKNHAIDESQQILSRLIGQDFHSATLRRPTGEWRLERHGPRYKLMEKSTPPSSQPVPSESHDRKKNRPLDPLNKPYLRQLGITGDSGEIRKSAQDKFRQINRYIEILSPLIAQLPDDREIHVVDMGSGKGYLTFALYDYAISRLRKKLRITGVETRSDMVTLCNEIARNSEMDRLNFVQATIDAFETDTIDVLIALHACDTATDDALYKGISKNAALIVVAPCCHKQIRGEMEKSSADNPMDYLMRHGIFLERQAEMVTDGLRSLILEYCGYKTKVFEFISDAHTAKNVMIVATKSSNPQKKRVELQRRIKDAKAFFGIGHHHLEKIL